MESNDENKFRELIERLIRLSNGDSFNSPPSYLAAELRDIVNELEQLKD